MLKKMHLHLARMAMAAMAAYDPGSRMCVGLGLSPQEIQLQC